MSLRDDRPPGIPRDDADDYGSGAVDARRGWLAGRSGADLAALRGIAADPHVFRGNIENLIGTVQCPVGVAGPFTIHGAHVDGDVFVPLATTEGALVASYSRGMKAVSSSGGARAWVADPELTMGVTFVFEAAAAARDFARWLVAETDALRRAAEGTTRHGRLLRVEPHVAGRRAFVNFVYDTADALGINLATAASAAACAVVLDRVKPRPLRMFLPGGMQGEKWTNALDYLHGRGRRASAEATITREVLSGQLRVDAQSMHEAWLGMGREGILERCRRPPPLDDDHRLHPYRHEPACLRAAAGHRGSRGRSVVVARAALGLGDRSRRTLLGCLAGPAAPCAGHRSARERRGTRRAGDRAWGGALHDGSRLRAISRSALDQSARRLRECRVARQRGRLLPGRQRRQDGGPAARV
jgi:hypothetical protein